MDTDTTLLILAGIFTGIFGLVCILYNLSNCCKKKNNQYQNFENIQSNI